MTEPSDQARFVLSFGRFELSPGERLLTCEGVRVELGARTLDVLIALASRPNEALGKQELMAQVWPDVIVEEGSLRFHIAGLRKALGDGKDGARYIATLAGRGYCFVAPVVRSVRPTNADVTPTAVSARANFLPSGPTRMIGRSEEVRLLSTQLAASRFITIVGAGGVGKTSVAVAVARELLDAFAEGALFLDLGLLNDPAMVAPTLASILGLSVQSDDATPSLTAYLRDKQMLVVLDCCEHVIEGAASLAARLFVAAPKIHILATSREPLRVDGERVHRLSPLALPPPDSRITAALARSFPATQLFVERAEAGGASAELDDAGAAIVAGICWKLDGVALAIELAAGRVAAYGLEQTAALLDQRLALQWPGHRTAPPRQKSLNATLDWSYRLLSETDRTVLRRLAVFVGSFTLQAAYAVAPHATIDRAGVLGAIDSLVGKSMIAAHPAGARMRYRLLDTTRAYLLEIGGESAGLAELAGRHANYYRQWLDQSAAELARLSNAAQRASHLADLNNVRAALEWCFGDAGDAKLGIGLAAVAAPVFFAMSLLTECQSWSQRAISALDEAMFGGREEMRLQAALGLSLMWTHGNSEATRSALERSMAIAKDLGDVFNQIQLLTPLHVYQLRIGQFAASLQYAENVAALSRTLDDPAAVALSRILLGFSLHFAGDLSGARRELEAALQRGKGEDRTHGPPDARRVSMDDDAMAAPIVALASSAAPSALARNLWLQGQPTRALELVRRTLGDAASAEHPVALLVALIHAITVLLWNGDLDEADEQIALFISIAQSYSLKSYIVLGRCFRQQWAIGRGDAATAIEPLRESLEDLRALRYEMLTTEFNISLVRALAALGRPAEGLATIDETIRRVQAQGDLCSMPELLRLKAALLLASSPSRSEEAETCLNESLALSRRQGARAWELRASIDMAKRLSTQGPSDRARTLLRPVLDQFADGSDSADLRTAQSLLEV